MATAGARPEPPLVVIVGPTASGKTALAVKLAKSCGGEVICADSRTIYKGLDIGTAKPTAQEQEGVQHWGLDLVEPGERFTAADFKRYATEKIADIRARGKVPFLVGGTGLYVDAVVFDFGFAKEVDLAKRQELEKLSVETLQERCKEYNILLPENDQNKRHLIASLERNGALPIRKNAPIANTIIVGITTDRDILRHRIASRAEQLFCDGVVEEAIKLGKKYGWESEALTGNIYPLIAKMLDGGLTVEQVKQQFITLDWRFAKRQLTWLKRNRYIKWLPREEAERYLTTELALE